MVCDAEGAVGLFVFRVCMWVGRVVRRAGSDSNNMSEEDSLDVQVEPPQEEKAKRVALINSWEFHAHCWEPLELRLYLVASDVYLRHLIERKEEPRISDLQRKRLGSEALILQNFDFDWITENGFTRERDSHKGELVLSFSQFHGLTLTLRLGELELRPEDTLQARYLYYPPGEQASYRTCPLQPHSVEPQAFTCTVDEKLFPQLLKPRLAVEVTVRRQAERQRKFRGIQNEGNTCYMNSTLQVLYFLRPLRKTVLDFDGKSALMDAIKRVFVQLLDVASDSASLRPVDASQLLAAYGRFPDPRKQQDIHEFLLGFLDELEQACPQLKELWLGHGKQLLASRDRSRPYESTVGEDFNELDLLLEDHKGNTLGTLGQALGMLLDEEHVEDRIETEEYGKVQVTKRRIFSELPKVVFFNLKRYSYRKDRNRLVKILADFEYPPSINLGFLQGTPSGIEEDYVLFGVAVHRGQAYNSGHYFSFVNTSPDPDQPHWIKFNDSVVTVSSAEAALGFTGGKRKSMAWSREYEKFVERELTSEETAYLLAYIRRDKFREYQSIATPLPRDWLIRMRAQEPKHSMTRDVELAVLEGETELFEEAISMPFAVNDDEEVLQQLARIGPGVLGCKVASVWKVNRTRKKVKQVINYVDFPQTPARLFGYRRGHTQPDFLLVVSDSFPIFRSMPLEGRRERLGLVCVVVPGQGKVEREWRVVGKDSLQDFKTEEEKRLGRLSRFEDKDRFVYDWTDHCVLLFE